MLDAHGIALICLGGFMRLFTAAFVQRWHGRMLNIHPSLLPSFPGLDPHGQALRAGVRISGATVHFVIPETDAGPIIAQGAVAVHDGDTADLLGGARARGRASHLSAGAAAARDGRVRLVDGRCVIDGAVASRRDADRSQMKNPRPKPGATGWTRGPDLYPVVAAIRRP